MKAKSLEIEKAKPQKNVEPKANASTTRSQRMTESMRLAGGARVVVNFRTKEELSPLDDLVAWGEGEDRNDVIRKLVQARHAQLAKKK